MAVRRVGKSLKKKTLGLILCDIKMIMETYVHLMEKSWNLIKTIAWEPWVQPKRHLICLVLVTYKSGIVKEHSFHILYWTY